MTINEGIRKKITMVSEVAKYFRVEGKHVWENLKKYQEDSVDERAYRADLDIAERALNAEAYHNQRARSVGYWGWYSILGGLTTITAAKSSTEVKSALRLLSS